MSKKYTHSQQDPPIVSDCQVEYNISSVTNDYHPILAFSNLEYISTNVIKIIQKGLPKSILYFLTEHLNVSMDRISDLIHISHRTLQRKSDNDLLGIHISEHIVAIIKVIKRGKVVIGSESAFKEWAHAKLPALEEKTPIDYMNTSLGCALLTRILGRIEHGVY
ncbi:MAG: antitoxin Xre/MbcA/ParS toxin-binding domain-containing protein [Saprospiraceae bacterium]